MAYSEEHIRNEVVSMCWKYLHDNFHKFTPTNQIRISLEIVKKAMPTEIDQTVTVNELPPVELGGRVKEYNFG